MRWWLGLALLLAGCDLAPRYHAPLTPTPMRYKEAAPWRPARPADRLPRGAWWRLFGDPALDRLEAGADAANPGLAEALATYRRAQSLAAEARARLFPSIALGGQVNSERQSNRRPRRRPGQPNSYPDTMADAQAKYEIDLWGHVANQVRAGKDLARSAADELANVRLMLHADLAADYIALRGLDAEEEVLRRSIATFGDGFTLARNRFRGGVAPILDVSRAESQLDDARAQLSEVQARRALYEHAVAVLAGQPPATLNLPPAAWTLRTPEPDPGLSSTLLQRRPDIAAAERRVAAANAEIGVVRAAFYPTLSLNLLYGLQATSLNVFSLPNSFWAVGPGLALPLFEGGLRNAEEKAAVAALEEEAARYRGTVLEAFREVEDRLSDLRLLGEALRHREAEAAAAARSLDVATNLYRDGAANFLEVVVAQNEALDAEKALVAARTRRTRASLGLIRALGGGWRETDPAG